MEEIIKSIEETYETFMSYKEGATEGNKSSARKMRVASVTLGKLFKQFREKSLEECK